MKLEQAMRLGNCIAYTIGVMLLATAAGCSHPELGGRTIPRPAEAPRPPKQTPVPLDQDLRAAARAELEKEAQSNSAELRANAIEGMQLGLGAAAKDAIVRAMDDDVSMVKYAACMSVGTLRIDGTEAKLIALADGPDRHVEVGALYALHRLGDFTRSQRLGTLAADTDPQTRADVAIALGLLGEPSAMGILKVLHDDSDFNVRVAAYEGMWRLGAKEGLQALVSLTLSQYPDDQIIALLALSGPKDRRVAGQLSSALTSDYVEVTLAAARGLGELGMDDGYAVAAAHLNDRDPRVRQMAAFALGAIGRSDAQSKLGPLLRDPDVRVRVVAATAILRLTPPPGS